MAVAEHTLHLSLLSTCVLLISLAMHNSVLERVNNRIKVIKRMAYGFRDSDYFFLKIKAVFPGKAL